jgi:inorganic triphosphatase YgiF
MDWPDRYSAALELELTDEEVDAILDLARQIAHATERRFAPLSTYLTGRYVARRQAEGATVDEALGEARAKVGKLLAG